MDDPVVTEKRRSSIEKAPVQVAADSDAFHRLPDEIIEQILLAAEPSDFASLVLLNSKWRATSQRPHLYTHQLAQCPSFATSHSPVPTAVDENLLALRRLFAREVKRNLFEAYLRPKRTLIKLVSNSISSSSCPGGEGMQFASSPRGQHLLAYNSSRIYVIDVCSPTVNVKREFKIQRRPASACITDDAHTLAVLSSEMQVDIYDLTQSPPHREHSLILDNKPQTIAISACGAVLAAAYDGGIEVSSLKSSALATEKRAVKCDAVDALAFSLDGTQLLGTTVNSSPPCTVVLTAPYYDPGSQLLEENLGAMWTTSILFPNTSRDCSHAIWLPDDEHGEPEWTFTYDRSFETFRAVRLDDLRNGTTYFTGPIPNAKLQTKLLPCTLPATTSQGELVSAGFQGNEVWIYGIPQDLDAIPEAPPASQDSTSNSNSSGLGRHNSTQSSLSRRTSIRGHDGAEAEPVPQWQVLCDKLRNNLVAGFKVAELSGVGSVKLVTDEEDIDFVDGGRIVLLDFDYGLVNGEAVEITIEVGTDSAEPLAEERRDLETEVAIVRRRTVAQKRGGSAALLRAATTAAGREPLPSLMQPGNKANDNDDDDPLAPRTVGQHPINRRTAAPTSQSEEEFASMEEQEALDAPYAHASPRSGTTLRRAATAAAVNRRLNPRTADGRPIEYRRADGRTEHPHESDADNWVPPPPPYQKEDPGDMPVFMRGPPVAPISATDDSADANKFPPSAGGSTGETLNNSLTLALEQSANATRDGTQYTRAHHQHTTSEATDIDRLQVPDVPRPTSSPSMLSVQGDDIYDVSPPASPRLSSAHPSEPAAPQDQMPSPASRGNTSAAASFDTAPSQQWTEFSPAISAAAPLSPGSSTGPGARPGAPILELRIPTSTLNIIPEPEAEPVVRRLSNARTWPKQVEQPGTQSNLGPSQRFSGHPYTAPPLHATANDFAAGSLPPAPSSTQIASLSKRISQGNPRRLSGNILNPQLWMGNGRSMNEPLGSPSQSQPPAIPADEERERFHVADFDRPLIISTPTGVSGSHDPPERRGSSAHAETPILAPIPRRPRPANFPRTGGTAQQLENIYNNQPAPASLPPHMRSTANALPMWMRTPSNSSRRTPNSVNRRRSRAERSAAKNVKDAKKKGWMPKKKKKESVPDSAGWVDITTPSKPKENKCVLM
ncbi:F-box domain protein [Metarhizium acridum CQMa 102]|uniref:F-box domain protein n=1 Tax=Metarhizium acridum (strain CQMa 102) TaxID=655827 RepID=E9E8F8_METAQ|nr:F-box domain protein [Metarhizium acridum CQMa 102]EFY87789.1 F-box domain protein [Metarhizium acridum CQMa 102]